MLKFGLSLILSSFALTASADYVKCPLVMRGGSLAERVDLVSSELIGKPYDKTGPFGEGTTGTVSRKPIATFERFDCTTYVEAVMACALSSNQDQFNQLIRLIRYEEGKVGYLTRNHFAERDWIPNNVRAGFFVDATTEVGGGRAGVVRATIDRAAWFKSKRDLPPAIQKAAGGYKPVSVLLAYVPTDVLLDSQAVRSRLQNGSVFNVVRFKTEWRKNGKLVKAGTIISHQGFIFRRGSQLYVRHASQEMGKVVEQPLDHYLRQISRNPTIAGLNILQVPSHF